jgi:radical SAM superfamily enzyme YgiQ (UPF0313 family)
LSRAKKSTGRRTAQRSPGLNRSELLELEKGTYHKKWTDRLPVGLVYPNSYRVGMSNLGYQLVYRLLNQNEHIVCERLFLHDSAGPMVSMESGRVSTDFPVLFCSVSFEHDYVNLARFFLLGGIEPLAARRSERIESGQPLVVCGGVATFMNPEPLAPFADLMVIGEAEPLLPVLLERLLDNLHGARSDERSALLQELNQNHRGFYAPRFYRPRYDGQARFSGFEPEAGLPERVEKVSQPGHQRAAHSELLTPQTEFADLYLAELGRGCSRGCRFCAAGFIYRPPRLFDIEAILHSLKQRPGTIDRVGLLGMEMTDTDNLEAIAEHISADGCSLSFSSLRADRISDNLLDLLGSSKLKSVAIAPDGASERLRRVINKQLTEADLLGAAERLTEAGIHRLKLYLMIGLPSETMADLEEFVDLVGKMRELMNRIGRKKKRLSQLSISLNSFIPKPWTPFQYHAYGVSEQLEVGAGCAGRDAVQHIRAKFRFLKKAIAPIPNTRIKSDNPEQELFQAVLARGDRRLAEVLLNMADSGISWKRAMKDQGLEADYFATRQYGPATPLPWSIIDHSIHDGYLWNEYLRSFDEKLSTACDTRFCRRCGVCDDQTAAR